MDEVLKKTAENIDQRMRDHAYSHRLSNSPNNFYCDPACVSQSLQIAVEREVKPLLERRSMWVFRIRDLRDVEFPNESERCWIEGVTEEFAQEDGLSPSWIYFFADLAALV